MIPRNVLFLAPRIAHVRSSLAPRVRNTIAISHRARLTPFHRHYATPGRPKTAVGESSPVKRTRKATGPAKSTNKKTTPVKKTKGPSKKPKVKTTLKKVLTEEQKAKKEVRKQAEKVKALKAAALKPPRTSQISAWNAYVAQNVKAGSAANPQVASIATDFKHLSAAELEHYNHVARTHSDTRAQALKSWVESHSIKDIAQANTARSALRKMDRAKNVKVKWPSIQDHRLPTKPTTSYLRFYKERNDSGDFKHIAVPERAKLASQEWKNLSSSEKSKYETEAHEAMRKYKAEIEGLQS